MCLLSPKRTRFFCSSFSYLELYFQKNQVPVHNHIEKMMEIVLLPFSREPKGSPILDILKPPRDLGDILTFILSIGNSNLKKKTVLPGTMNNSSYLNSVSFHHIKYKIFFNYQNSISQLF